MKEWKLRDQFRLACRVAVESMTSWLLIGAIKHDPDAHESTGKTWPLHKKRVKPRKISLRGIFGAAVLATTVHPLMGEQFPTAQEFLEDEGLPPELVHQIAGDAHIHVRERDLLGTLHTYTSIPTFLGLQEVHDTYEDKENAFHARPYFDIREKFFDTDMSMVSLPDRDTTAKEYISFFTLIPEHLIENTPLSQEEMFQLIALHEFRHASKENNLYGYAEAEADADLHAVKALSGVSDNPEIANTLLALRSMFPLVKNHDTALFLNAELNDEERPAHYLAQAATRTAIYMSYDHIDADDTRPYFIKVSEALAYITKNRRDDMSRWAIKRAELYMQGAAYLAPSSVAHIDHPAIRRGLKAAGHAQQCLRPPEIDLVLPPFPADNAPGV